MADIFPVDTSGIDMANQVFNYYMPDASITGDVKVLDQDYGTGIVLNPGTDTVVMLGQHVYINDIYIQYELGYGSFPHYIMVDTTSDNGTTWTDTSQIEGHPTYSIYNVQNVINGIRIRVLSINDSPITLFRVAAYAPEDATHPTEGQKFVIRQGGVPVRTHDFGNISLESGVYETFEVYNTGSTILSGIRIYEVKDDNNDSNVYYKFSLDSSTWYDHSMTIDEPLYPSSGITFYAMVYAPSDASFGNNTIYFRVLAYDTGTEP